MSTAADAPFAARQEGLRRRAAEAGLDGVAVVPGPNMVYLTGLSFHLSERPAVAFFPVEGTPAVVVPALEAGKIAAGTVLAPHPYDDATGPARAMRQALDACGLLGRALGVEARRMRFVELELMARGMDGPRIFGADAVFAALRMRKDDAEMVRMRRAVAIAETAFSATLPCLLEGRTEREVASELTVQLLRAGSAPELPFSPIVASGPNGALPHAVPTLRALRAGDVVTLDWGAAFEGYLSDITRNVVIAGAEPHPDLVRAHAAVAAATAAGRDAARPGATGQDVDRAARAVLERAGFGEHFVHRTGHGLGMEGHEEPDMTEGERMPLAPGMTFTVEPGVYLPGLGGVRIEDDVAVVPGGAETLTTLSRELVTVGRAVRDA